MNGNSTPLLEALQDLPDSPLEEVAPPVKKDETLWERERLIEEAWANSDGTALGRPPQRESLTEETWGKWLARKDVPEGFHFDLPEEPFRAYRLHVEEWGAGIERLDTEKEHLGWGEREAEFRKREDIFKKVYSQNASKYAPSDGSPPFAALPSLRAEKAAVAEEQKRYDHLLSQERIEAREVLSAWVHVLVKHGGIDRGTLSRFTAEESSDLWESVVFGHSTALRSRLERLGDSFSASTVVTRMTLVALLWHAKRMAQWKETLLFLNAKHVTFEAVQHALVFDQEPPSWEEMQQQQSEPDARVKHADNKDWIITRLEERLGKHPTTQDDWASSVVEDYAEEFGRTISKRQVLRYWRQEKGSK